MIDIDWQQIEEGKEEAGDSLTQSWAVISEQKEPEVKVNLNDFNSEETMLYNQEKRQMLINDLEECEFFLRQRLTELLAKDSAAYQMYSEGGSKSEIIKKCDSVEFLQKAIKAVEQVMGLINHKDLLQLLLVRQKPQYD